MTTVEITPGYWGTIENGVIVSAYYTAVAEGFTLQEGQTLTEVSGPSAFSEALQQQLINEAAFIVAQGRRAERDAEFALTLDKVNPWWYNSLTDAQRTEVGTWRQAWLDYPTSGTKPTTTPDVFNPYTT